MAAHLLADLEANRDRFISRVRVSRTIWGLRSDQGWAYCPSNHTDAEVLLFWSEEAYAKRLAVAEWAAYQATPIDLDAFVDGWLRGMHQDGALAGVNFNADLAGIELKPTELARALIDEA
jgi:hypothetical protein